MNASTGQYTYTPAAGFSGTTVATYTLCNVLSPPCSTTTITFTVFPTLVANPDVIATTPSVTTTGSLLTNDGGASSSGATYSVSVTQPAATTGTITLNPTTGQYTFVPNPAFTGTASTTYTVCNAAVTPSVCSTTSILIQVGNVPVAVSNTNTTMQNTAVSGNVGTNDTGTNVGLNPVFTTGQPTAGTGTLVMNASTGQYTYTPAAGFSGTTVATYTLCNVLSPPCSTTTITFTVFPTLVANPDVIATTPSVTTTGSLLTNDGGASSPGATYSVSVTQPAATTGTITLNPTTGQYTFVPNPAFTGTASTTYTVCNTAVTPSVCSTTSILIQVGNTPVAVADFTNTILNTPVSGNVGTNDGGNLPTLNPVFTTGQPTAGTGTLVMNASTGQYTYTPASGFTGTTIATYTLCNILSPPCSTTTITFTVFPQLVAISNTFVTAPATGTTGDLATNDLGVVVGATYSVSITQPAATTGTFVINPTTGQYTFTPNATFIGTASTTYTICNTSVNPNVCSNTTITFTVGNLPTAVPDGTITMQNIPVSGNVGTNDTGTNPGLNPVFTTGQPTAGTGTLVMNASTGQYTYTPAAGFSGTTVATYTLCNVLSPPCSTTTITFTVFPTLVANPDVIATTPSVTTTGSLLTNDGGASSPGATYSVSITQPAATTGTITLNPTTGQYTFVPNPAFTGTASTTYTVCNTAVTPSVCSTTSILIQVGNTPVAVADFTNTILNTPVSGNAGTNDSGASPSLNPLFTVGTTTAGTITMNPSTGQYTFTPNAGFTGTTQVTYTLCNLTSPPCSTTTITFTVFPTLVANPDVIATTPSVTTTGSLLTNDGGASSPGATYSVSVTQPAATTGTITLNPTTGQYTFVPNPAFTGTASTTYTVCNTAVTPSVCSTTSILIQVGNLPVAVDDGTVTLINTPVSGNASTNDSGASPALNPVFTVGTTTAGVITMNPGTGQYTFTPNAGFTGTTQVTYTLCNLSSPPCSTANITFTVFPTLIANDDFVPTSPSVTVTGTLTANDNGLVPGGTYSVNATPFNPTTGTITVNPTTGQYTFVPNPTFTGTASTTYTICQFVPPSTIAIQCSTANIIVSVSNAPIAVNDNTVTLINTPVSGTLTLNDVNATGGTVTIGSTPNGTITVNPSTGQYTFTPTPGFTGTTSTTYTLCNGLPVACSTANITFTVFPALIANDDFVPTSPSVTVTGTLTANDNGIVPGGTYSVNATPFNPSTGTITVNPTTGQYTFVPNPTFTGTASTTYTICQFVPPSTIAIQCSTANIIVSVSNAPIAVNDNTVTLINTPVSGTLTLNDVNATGGTVTIGSTPNGTITVNPSTGQYTFTPTPGFTGTTSTTYTLCNGLPVACSTANITFTLFPALIANDDFVPTSPSVTATGTLTANDNGIVPGGTYSVNATPFNPTTGTITVNPTTGQYTFVPNPAFTGTASTTYTICQFVPPSTIAIQCSTANIIVSVSNGPIAVNDNTVTLINTPVSGTLTLNDINATGGTVTIGSTPNGTITVNPSTGQYTFTPTPGFTGTTSTTYTLCNGLPVACSTANITFTVFPTLIANDDFVPTSPSVTVTGTLTANDNGLVPGGTYSVNATPFNPTTGTITVNPTTGQYTFVPNPAFTGTASTTYTICQFVPPSTIAIQCSTANIIVSVSNAPIAVNDNTVTLINTPVSGTLTLNDVNATGGTVTIGSTPNGTITVNPTTGQYTFTPTPGFTGTTSTTYTLCNGLPVACSTANITFTVFPALIANDDFVPTSPSVTVTGTLTANDNGIVPGGTYSVNATPFNPSTGTITVNPTTGQYTFVPNPTFTGTASTTYTICQFVPPSTIAIQCSTANIIVSVSNAPIAVNDNTVTLINTPVSGTLTLNDVNATGGTVTIGSTPNGTITVNPSTGQYTFTPTPGFTGTTSTTYTLCNGLPVACSTANITFTVFPALIAINDLAITAPTVAVTGTLTTNDIGLVSGGTYSTTVTQPSSTVGVISVNPSTGQFTFTPAPGFTGTATTTYTICQYVPPSTVALQCSTATITLVVGDIPLVGAAKSISTPTYNTNGTIDLRYKIVVKNYGTSALTNVSVSDNLAATFPSPTTFTVVNTPSIITSAGTQLSLNAGYTGSGSNTVITIPATSSLAIGRTDTLVFGVRISPNEFFGPYNNTAIVSANGGTNTVTDISTNGNNPDPTGTGPGTSGAPTSFTPQVVRIGVAKQASKVESDGNGCNFVTFKFTVKNFGTDTVYNVNLIDNLNNTFASPATYTVVSAPQSINGFLIPNTAFTGNGTNTNLLAANSKLGGGRTDTISVKVRFCANGVTSFSNTAVVSGNSLSNGLGASGSDVSTNGTNPDPNGNGNPNDTDESSVTVFTGDAELNIPQGFSPNGDGVNDVFVIRGIERYPNNEFTIINRWGNIVYKANGYQNTWNGKATEGVKFGGDDLPEGTYFYILDLGNGDKPYKGYIYLNRADK